MIGVLFKCFDLVRQFGGWGIAVLFAVWFVGILLDEDRSALFRARVYKVIYTITRRVDAEKKYIANDIRGRLNLARRVMHLGKSVLPRAVEVQWIEGGTGSSHDIREGQFVIRLDPSAQQERNIAQLATAIVKRTTLQGIRHSVEAPLQTAIDLNLARSLISHVGNKSALDYFLSGEYRPQVERDQITKAWNGKILAIDERGLFIRILLVELEDFAKRVYGLAPRPYMAGEIEGLVDFLYNIAVKKAGGRIRLDFQHAYIRVSVIIVAKTDKLLTSIEPYVKRMHVSLQKGHFSVYVLAYDKDWLGEVDPESYRRFEEQLHLLKEELDKATVARKDFDIEFTCVDQQGKSRRARCIRYLAPPPQGG